MDNNRSDEERYLAQLGSKDDGGCFDLSAGCLILKFVISINFFGDNAMGKMGQRKTIFSIKMKIIAEN